MTQLKQNMLQINDRASNIEETVKKLAQDNKEFKSRVDTLEKDVGSLKDDKEKLLDQMAFLELRQKERFLRFRGIPEKADQNIKKLLGEELASLLGITAGEMEAQIETAFRLNSDFATRNKLTKDRLGAIYF